MFSFKIFSIQMPVKISEVCRYLQVLLNRFILLQEAAVVFGYFFFL